MVSLFLFLFLWFKRTWEHGFEWLRETQYHYLETNERRLSRTYVAWSGSIYRMQRLSTKKKTTRGMHQVHKWTRSIIMVGHVARNPGNKGMHAKGSQFVSCPVLIHKSRSKRMILDQISSSGQADGPRKHARCDFPSKYSAWEERRNSSSSQADGPHKQATCPFPSK